MTTAQLKALAQGMAFMAYDYNIAQAERSAARRAENWKSEGFRAGQRDALEDAITDLSGDYRKAGLTVRKVCYHGAYGKAYAAIQLTDIEAKATVIYEVDQAWQELTDDDMEMWQTVCRARREKAQDALKAGKFTELECVE
ncbi:MAG: hypothetical protein J6Y26_05410, partial [Lachnospiraceae bacterium]|nr:hypothetical protein [Lachnospiraceae bacterium]